MRFRPIDGGIIAVENKLIVDIRLDDRNQSHIIRKIAVHHVEEIGYIGVEFIDFNQFVYDKILGFYLMAD